MDSPVLLGIESSCDDTAAAVAANGTLRSNVISSRHAVHEAYGGVVPELASRDHQRLIVPVVQQALAEAGVAQEALDAVAVTYGPGLAGSLLVGLSFAKAFALGLGVPLVGVNHLEGHIYSARIEEPMPPFPYLCLVVSGGHTQLVRVDDGFRHTVLGRTRDDAAGEAFDKVAQLLGLGYPGGPEIDRHARTGDPAFHHFPRAELDGFDFSFSGLKTSVLMLSHRPHERTLAAIRRWDTTCPGSPKPAAPRSWPLPSPTSAPPPSRPSSTCWWARCGRPCAKRASSTWPSPAASRPTAPCEPPRRRPAPRTVLPSTFPIWPTAWTTPR